MRLLASASLDLNAARAPLMLPFVYALRGGATARLTLPESTPTLMRCEAEVHELLEVGRVRGC